MRTHRDNDAGVEDPGTAELGNFVFFDENRDGVFNGNDTVAAGVEVKLLDSNGQQVGASQTTDANGNYLFTGLKAGGYQVMFTALAGFMFTQEGAAADDAVNNDSDADTSSGMTDLVMLSIGESELDIDAGLVRKNDAPIAVDDMGMICANEVLTLKPLSNDSDPNGDDLTLLKIDGQQIADGQTITVDGTATVGGQSFAFTGLSVTLDGTMVKIDGEAAFEALDIGEKAELSISYMVGDGTDTATANLDLTFCGTAETLEEIAESLPESITYKVGNALVAPFDPDNILPNAFDLEIVDAGDARLDGVVFLEAYCLSQTEVAGSGATLDVATDLTGDLYLGTEDAIPSGLFNADQIGVNGLGAAENLDLITYILNQDYEGQGFSGWEVQYAIWALTDNFDFEPFNAAYPQFGEADDVQLILDDALANGEGYVAGQNDLVALIIDPNPSTEANAQPFIIAAEFGDLDCIC